MRLRASIALSSERGGAPGERTARQASVAGDGVGVEGGEAGFLLEEVGSVRR